MLRFTALRCGTLAIWAPCVSDRHNRRCDVLWVYVQVTLKSTLKILIWVCRKRSRRVDEIDSLTVSVLELDHEFQVLPSMFGLILYRAVHPRFASDVVNPDAFFDLWSFILQFGIYSGQF